MNPTQIEIIGIPGIPEVGVGDSIPQLLLDALRGAAITVRAGDILIVAQKIVSKSEGRLVRLADVVASDLARRWGVLSGRDPRLVEVILGESKRVVRMDPPHLIVEQLAGFICANAGVDQSNTPEGTVSLLPEDCDASAQRIRQGLSRELGLDLAVVISDTFGRPWREGIVNVAIGVAGMEPVLDLRGKEDGGGRKLETTLVGVADEVASAAELVMGKNRRVPAALVSGYRYCPGDSGAGALIRAPEKDLFR